MENKVGFTKQNGKLYPTIKVTEETIDSGAVSFILKNVTTVDLKMGSTYFNQEGEIKELS